MLRHAVFCLALATCSCTYFTGDSHVIVTSKPAGAEILLDGEATGLSTPAKMDLGGVFGGSHRLTLRKQGFEDEARMVYHYTTTYSSRWVDGAAEIEIFAAPLFWTVGDFVMPLAVQWQYVPHEFYVVLYPQGEAPVRQDGS